jgi:hypothetical protein
MADLVIETSLQIARATAQIDPCTRHDDLLDASNVLAQLNAQQTNEVIAKTSDADLIALFDDVYAKGDSGSQGLSFDEKRTLLTKLGSSLDAEQLGRVNARLTDADAAALADVLGDMQPGLAKEFSNLQAQQLVKRDQRGITPDSEARTEAHGEEYDLPPGGVPSKPTAPARGSAADNQARDAVLACREMESVGTVASNALIDTANGGWKMPFQTIEQWALKGKDAAAWAAYKVQDTGDKALQIAACVSTVTQSRGTAGCTLRDRIAQPEPQSQFGQNLKYGMPSAFGGQASTTEVVARETWFVGIPFAASDAVTLAKQGDATDVFEMVGGLTVGGLLLEQGVMSPLRRVGSAAVEGRAPQVMPQPTPHITPQAFGIARPELDFDVETLPKVAISERPPAPVVTEAWPLEPGLSGNGNAPGFGPKLSKSERDFQSRQQGLQQAPWHIAAIDSNDPHLPPAGRTFTVNDVPYADLRDRRPEIPITVNKYEVSIGNADEWYRAKVAALSGTYTGTPLKPNYFQIKNWGTRLVPDWGPSIILSNKSVLGVSMAELIHNAMNLLRETNGHYPGSLNMTFPAFIEIPPTVMNLPQYTGSRLADAQLVSFGRPGIIGTEYARAMRLMKDPVNPQTLERAVMQTRMGESLLAPYGYTPSDQIQLIEGHRIEAPMRRSP